MGKSCELKRRILKDNEENSEDINVVQMKAFTWDYSKKFGLINLMAAFYI